MFISNFFKKKSSVETFKEIFEDLKKYIKITTTVTAVSSVALNKKFEIIDKNSKFIRFF